MMGRIVLGVVGGAVLLFLVAPMFAVVPMSFDSSGLMSLVPSDPGLAQYRRFFTSPEWMEALARSFEVAAGTTLVATGAGGSSAPGVHPAPAAAPQGGQA